MVHICTILYREAIRPCAGSYSWGVAQRGLLRRPAQYVQDGHWPHAQLRADAPETIHAVQEFVASLDAVMRRDRLSSRALSTRSGVAHSTIGRLLAGEVLCDIGTLAALETALGESLWPGRRAS